MDGLPFGGHSWEPRSFEPLGEEEEHDVEVDGASRLPLRLQPLHQLVEGHVLVGVPVGAQLPDAIDEFGEARVAFEVGAQGEGVAEVADQLLEAGEVAVHDSRADGDVGGAGGAVQQGGQSREQHHEGGHAGVAGEGGEPVGDVGVEGVESTVTVGGGAGGAWGVGGQGERAGRGDEGGAPVVEVLGQSLVGPGGALPVCEVTILERELFEPRAFAGGCRAVEVGQVVGEGVERPAVPGYVMDGQNEGVILLRSLDEQGAEWVFGGEREGGGRGRSGQLRRSAVLFVLRQRAQVGRGGLHLRLGVDELLRGAVGAGRVAGAQNLVAVDQAL